MEQPARPGFLGFYKNIEKRKKGQIPRNLRRDFFGKTSKNDLK
jgi:hypothetical protein